MNDTELLQEVKNRMLITTDYHDEMLKGFIRDTKEFLIDSGVLKEVVDSEVSVGVIARGVADLFNVGTGDGEYSSLFYKRAIQLTYKEVIQDV